MLSVRLCPRCSIEQLHETRGSVTQCQTCGYATHGGRVITIGETDEDRRRGKYRLDPIDEVAP